MAYRSRRARRQTGVDVQINRDLIVFDGDRDWRRRLMDDPVIAQILSEQRAQAQLHSARRDLLRSGLRLTPAIAPDAWQAADACKATLGLGLPVELYCVNEPLLNAFVAPPQHGRILIGVTNVALENLTTAELRFLIGHELGHAIFEHFALAPSVFEHDERIAPIHMARLFAWMRYAELTADRVGLVCCGQYTDAVRAFFKLTSGLRSERFLEHAVESAAQFAELAAESLDSNEEDWFSTHPYGPMRLRALEFFSRSQAFHSLTGQGDGALTERELEKEVRAIMTLMDPSFLNDNTPHHDEIVAFIAQACTLIAYADGTLKRAERRFVDELLGGEDIIAEVKESLRAGSFEKAIEYTAAQGAQLAIGLSLGTRRKICEDLVALAICDGQLDDAELELLEIFARALRVDPLQVHDALARLDRALD